MANWTWNDWILTGFAALATLGVAMLVWEEIRRREERARDAGDPLGRLVAEPLNEPEPTIRMVAPYFHGPDNGPGNRGFGERELTAGQLVPVVRSCPATRPECPHGCTRADCDALVVDTANAFGAKEPREAAFRAASTEHPNDALCATCGKPWSLHFGRCCDPDAGETDRRFVLAAHGVRAPFERGSWQHAVDDELVNYGRTSQEFATPREAVKWLLSVERDAPLACLSVTPECRESGCAAARNAGVPGTPQRGHCWHDYGQLGGENVSWCSVCDALAFTGREPDTPCGVNPSSHPHQENPQ